MKIWRVQSEGIGRTLLSASSEIFIKGLDKRQVRRDTFYDTVNTHGKTPKPKKKKNRNVRAILEVETASLLNFDRNLFRRPRLT